MVTSRALPKTARCWHDDYHHSSWEVLPAILQAEACACCLALSLLLAGCGASSPMVRITAPAISTQPSNQTVTAGQTATFSVTATGTAPLSYQWQKGTTSIAGATSASYTTAPTTTADNGSQFKVVVSNSTGNITSNAATLTVNSAPVAPSISQQPSNQTVTVGQTATFSVTATGTAPLSYQWQKGTTQIAGATSASYTTPRRPPLTTARNSTSWSATRWEHDQQCGHAHGECRGSLNRCSDLPQRHRPHRAESD